MFVIGKRNPPPSVEPGVRGYLQMSVHMSTGMPVPPGFTYSSAYDFTLDRGRSFASSPLTADEDATVRAAMSGQVFEAKGCFYNAHLMVANDRSGTLVYTEGFAYNGMATIHHGWVTINGKVVDVTWNGGVFGTLPDGWEYYGVEFPDRDALLRRMARTGQASSVIIDQEGGHPVMKWPRMSA